MTKDKKILYAVSFILTVALLGLLFVKGDGGRYLAAVFLSLATFVYLKTIKKRSIYSIYKKQVALLLGMSALLVITLFYLSGLHFGFRAATVPFSLHNVLKHILPITAIIVSSELLRAVMLAQRKRLVSILAWMVGIATELRCSLALIDINNVNRLMELVGMTVFPAMLASLAYNYLSARYGARPNIVYRLLIALYPYVIPIYPTPPDPLKAFAKMLIPLLIYLFIAALYEKKPRRARERKSKWRFVWSGAAIAIALAFLALISCQFRFGTIVIGSGSMTGELNVGDAIIYERYEDQVIEENDVIVFTRSDSRVVHRVVKIEHINGQTRYYTKGDANESQDTGYVTESEIIGVTDFKIAYIGYPTVWLHRLFANRS